MKDDEDELGQEEVRKAIMGLKNGKTVESGGIPGKVWKYAVEQLKG